MNFKGKIALVTGGSRGIGRAISLNLARKGATVIINYFLNRKAAEQTVDDIKNMGGTAHIIKANLGDVEKINAMFDSIAGNFGKLDIFISNAASGTARSAMELDPQVWDWTMDINAKAFLLCTKRAAKLMEGRKGKIVAISSLGSFLVWSSYTIVGVSKAALEALTRYLAIELAPMGISVNAVSASGIMTESLASYIGDLPDASMYQQTPAGRALVPEDVANVVSFLCSDDAEMIRGQTIIVDGGISITPLFNVKSKSC